MNVPFLVSNILSGCGMVAMLASTALRSRRKILAVQSVNHALSIAACSLLRGWSGAVQEAVNLVRDLAVLAFGRLNRFCQIFFVSAALGTVVSLFANPLVFLLLVVVPLVLLLGFELANLVKSTKEVARAEDEAALRAAVEQVRRKRAAEKAEAEQADADKPEDSPKGE